MNTIEYDLNGARAKFKVLNAVNGGPLHRRHVTGQNRSTLEEYKALKIPYNRNHDANHYGFHGGPYAHDVTAIFPDFDADPYQPDSYDFACTDESLAICKEAGTEVFYRLGQSTELHIVKHGANPPKDFHKWAVICEHIIRHYTEGWANGFYYNIQYWEIWNEPDLGEEGPLAYKHFWTGTRHQFFDFYQAVAEHLKTCFPHLKIGGPSLAFNVSWLDEFLKEMKRRNVPIDFVSWHSYCKHPERMLEKATTINEILKENNYGYVERILNEWNYVRSWKGEEFTYSLNMIQKIKGASFIMACMCAVQNTNLIDMLMYYDLYLSAWNAVFDFRTFGKLKGYYAFYWAGMFAECAYALKPKTEEEYIYTMCGVDKTGKTLTVLTYYADDDTLPNKEITIKLKEGVKYEIYLLDEEHDGELIDVTDKLNFNMKLYDLLLIKEVGN